MPRTQRPLGYSMVTIELKAGADIVVRRSIDEAAAWFTRFGEVLSGSGEDPIALVAPSVLVPEYNVVLYPRATAFKPDFVSVKSVVPFRFDERFFDDPALAASL